MVEFDECAITVAMFDANSNRANLNCNRNLSNSKSEEDENPSLGITQALGHFIMKTYKNYTKKYVQQKT